MEQSVKLGSEFIASIIVYICSANQLLPFLLLSRPIFADDNHRQQQQQQQQQQLGVVGKRTRNRSGGRWTALWTATIVMIIVSGTHAAGQPDGDREKREIQPSVLANSRRGESGQIGAESIGTVCLLQCNSEMMRSVEQLGMNSTINGPPTSSSPDSPAAKAAAAAESAGPSAPASYTGEKGLSGEEDAGPPSPAGSASASASTSDNPVINPLLYNKEYFNNYCQYHEDSLKCLSNCPDGGQKESFIKAYRDSLFICTEYKEDFVQAIPCLKRSFNAVRDGCHGMCNASQLLDIVQLGMRAEKAENWQIVTESLGKACRIADCLTTCQRPIIMELCRTDTAAQLTEDYLRKSIQPFKEFVTKSMGEAVWPEECIWNDGGRDEIDINHNAEQQQASEHYISIASRPTTLPTTIHFSFLLLLFLFVSSSNLISFSF